MDDMQFLDIDPDSMEHILSNVKNYDMYRMRDIKNRKLHGHLDAEVKRRVLSAINKYNNCNNIYCLDDFETDLYSLIKYTNPNIHLFEYIKEKDEQLYIDLLGIGLLDVIQHGAKYEKIKMYLDMGADPNYSKYTYGRYITDRPMSECLKYVKHTETPDDNIKLLLEYGALLSSTDILVLFNYMTRRSIDIVDITKYIFDNIPYAKEEYCKDFIYFSLKEELYDLAYYLINEVGCATLSTQELKEGYRTSIMKMDVYGMLFYFKLFNIDDIEVHSISKNFMKHISRQYKEAEDDERTQINEMMKYINVRQ